LKPVFRVDCAINQSLKLGHDFQWWCKLKRVEYRGYSA
jgi:hypothetical protein